MNKYKRKLLGIVTIFIITIQSSCYARNIPQDFPSISCPAAILINMADNEILFQKNAYEKMYPASTTKIMTAILVLESRNAPHRYCNCKRICC